MLPHPALECRFDTAVEAKMRDHKVLSPQSARAVPQTKPAAKRHINCFVASCVSRVLEEHARVPANVVQEEALRQVVSTAFPSASHTNVVPSDGLPLQRGVRRAVTEEDLQDRLLRSATDPLERLHLQRLAQDFCVFDAKQLLVIME